MAPFELDAVQARDAIARGELSAEALTASCLARIAELEPRVRAWAWLDPEQALTQARAADRRQREGSALGALHGVPVGIKDIVDTADMPTENGTVLDAGRRPAVDATVVARLRADGAVILGKTVTTELAVYAPGKTTNPHDAGHTPGGSSSGSAAAVAAGMVPLAIGTQTNGSVLRPASYCGVVGYKPSADLIPRHGVLTQSPTLDQIGVFARSVDDATLIARVLVGPDGRDADVLANAQAALGEAAAADSGRSRSGPPRLAFVRSPVWEHTSATTRQAFAALVDGLGGAVREVEPPAIVGSAHGWHRTIMESDLAAHYGAYLERGREQLSPTLCEMIERGRTYLAMDYSLARDGRTELGRAIDALFDDCDAILTPATATAAPAGLASTGSPMFCTIWTLAGSPAISLPVLRGEGGLPLGAQLVGRRGGDAALLRVARWLDAQLAR